MTPRQPDRDHISRPPGANSRPETGNMRFGCELIFYLHSDTSFPYFLEKRPLYFRALFPRLVPSYSRVRKKASSPMSNIRRYHYDASSLRTALPGMRTKLGKPAPLDLRRVFLSSRNHLRLRRDPGLDCPGNVSAANALRSGRRTCGAMPNCCRCLRASSRGCRSGSRLCSRRRVSRQRLASKQERREDRRAESLPQE